MEKRKRHYSLELVKELILNGNWEISTTALTNAWFDFSFLESDIYDVILELVPGDFYKSMTFYNNSTIWQDVYRPVLKGIKAYIKISIINNQSVLIQFKRK